jgi:hypothetical protein
MAYIGGRRGLAPPHKRDSKMVDFTFTAPKKMAEEGSKVERKISVEKTNAGTWTVNGHALSPETVDHAVAFAIRQRLANSYASAGTLKKDDVPLSLKDREKAFGEMFDKVLGKLTDPKALPSWETVFIPGEGSESLDPVLKEMFAMVATKLRAIAKKSEKTLPKMNTDEYRTLRDKYLAKNESTLRPLAEEIVANRESIEVDDDFEI